MLKLLSQILITSLLLVSFANISAKAENCSSDPQLSNIKPLISSMHNKNCMFTREVSAFGTNCKIEEQNMRKRLHDICKGKVPGWTSKNCSIGIVHELDNNTKPSYLCSSDVGVFRAEVYCKTPGISFRVGGEGCEINKDCARRPTNGCKLCTLPGLRGNCLDTHNTAYSANLVPNGFNDNIESAAASFNCRLTVYEHIDNNWGYENAGKYTRLPGQNSDLGYMKGETSSFECICN